MTVLFKAIAGSHLFGLDTKSSDKDYKGIYLPSKEEILLGNYSSTRSSSTGVNDTKNSKDDVDVELYSLPKFFKMLHNGDTAALELLFTPDEFVVESTPEWEYIRSFRSQLVSKKVSAMIGYARQQAAKYGIKGSRMGELSIVIAKLDELERSFDFPKPKLKLKWEELTEAFKKLRHVHEIELEMKTDQEDRKVPAFDILGKKFDHHCTFQHVLQHLKRTYKEYGYRAREAKKNNGIDWKALSHAMRVMFQGRELLLTHTISLPHVGGRKDLLLSVKQGLVEFSEVSSMLEDQLQELEEIKVKSDLPERVSEDLTKKLTIELFEKVVNGTL